MKKIILISVLAVIFSFAACEKEDDCAKNNTCTIEFSNGSDVAYSITVNNNFVANLGAKKKMTKTFTAGFQKVEVTPVVWDPSVSSKTYEANVKACENKYLVFP